MSTDKTGMSTDNSGVPPIHGNHTEGQHSSEPTIAQLNAAATAEAAAEAMNTPHSGVKHHDDLIADLRREASDLKDKYLRAHADMDNLRKRTEREKEDAAKYANTRFARDLLTIGDTFQRALASVPPGAADADPVLKSVVDGVQMTEREFLSVLDKHGVKRIEAQGQPFNPHLHQAVMQQANADVPEGTVITVFQPGYTIEDRTLRPAMVIVSTGGPKAAKPVAASPQAAGEAPGGDGKAG
jgi:molecular chaperone GrpE